MTIQLAARQRPLSNRTHMLALALLVVGAVLVVGLYMAPQYAGVAATSSEASPMQPVVRSADTPRSECTVTGDLAGDANPADIAAILCVAPTAISGDALQHSYLLM